MVVKIIINMILVLIFFLQTKYKPYFLKNIDYETMVGFLNQYSFKFLFLFQLSADRKFAVCGGPKRRTYVTFYCNNLHKRERSGKPLVL